MSFVFGLSNIDYRFDSLQVSLDIPCLFFVMFTRINFDLFQHCRLYSLTLQLFISSTLFTRKQLCLSILVFAYFGYFKPF